jgi:hypothetical protein
MKTTSLCVLVLLVTLLAELDDPELIDARLTARAVRVACAMVESGRVLGLGGLESAGCLAGGLYVNSRYTQFSSVYIYKCTKRQRIPPHIRHQATAPIFERGPLRNSVLSPWRA